MAMKLQIADTPWAGRKRVASFFNPELTDAQKKAAIAESAESPDKFRKWVAAIADPIVLGLDETSTVRAIYDVQRFEVGEEITYPVFVRDELVSGAWTVPQLYAQPTQLPVADLASPNIIEVTTSIEWPTRMQQSGRIDIVDLVLRVLSENIAVAEEETGWALLATASTTAQAAVTMGATTFKPAGLKALMSAMVYVSASPNQQKGRQLTHAYGAPNRLLDVIDSDWQGYWGDATKQAVMRSGAMTSVFGVQLLPYYGLATDLMYGFDLTVPSDAFNMAEQGAPETAELVSSADHWRVGVKYRERIGFLVKDARYIIKGNLTT